MTNTYTASATFTRTHAAYIASKVAADLRQMQRFYGKPSDAEIAAYIEELVELLVGGYLASVDYGFRSNNKWVVALSYTAYGNSIISTDDRSGHVPVGVDVSGASWGSYLRKNDAFNNLLTADQQRIEANLPIKRSTTEEPQPSNGIWTSDRAYSSNGTALQRRTYKPF